MLEAFISYGFDFGAFGYEPTAPFGICLKQVAAYFIFLRFFSA